MSIAAPLLYAHSYAADVPARGPVIAGADISFRRSEQDIQRPGQMRRIAAAYLRLWKLPELVDAALLPLSELVTNAFRHGAGAVVDVRLYFTEAYLCIEVDDGSPWVPRRYPAEPLAKGGRGLDVVDALADVWGVTEDGTRVWCLIRRDLGQPEGAR
ncbi:ATP-binding protein (plasmid) [Streptomyces sp. NBC_00161]|uniref:ATP-binding protein n=1 Tax=Streptomyces sp. NBC_00161 TaxID=2975671 RepID=UPI002F91158E